jgi:hypothetical protein
MYTSVKEFAKAKQRELNKLSTKKVNENVTSKTTTKIATNEAVENDKLGSLIKKLSICHFIINKGLISESSSVDSINTAISDEFEEENYFGTEEEFNNFYSNTMEETSDFVENEGFFSKSDDKELRDAKAKEFDEVNAKLVGTKGDQTANKEKWLDRAKDQDKYNGSFTIDRGVLQYVAKSKNPLQDKTGGSSGMGTANG